jgi:hypothetical protein
VTWDVTASDTSPTWTSLQVGAVAVDPMNENTVYAGTGDIRTALRAYGFGLLRSPDGGSTWGNLKPLADAAITRVLVDPDGPTNLVFTTIDTTNSSTGTIWRSTNSGVNWDQVAPTTAGWWDASISGRDKTGKRYYYVVGVDAMSNPRIYVSQDRGLNWAEVTANAGLTGFSDTACVSASQVNPQTVYVMSNTRFRKVVNGPIFRRGVITRSDDAGMNWNSISGAGSRFPTDDSPGDFYNWSQSFYDVHLEAAWVPGTSVDVVYAGLITLAGCTNGNTGGSWTNFTHSYDAAPPALTHNDQQCLAFNPRNPNDVIFGNDGGVYKVSYDPVGRGWGPVTTNNNRTLGISQFYGMAVSTTDSNHISGGTQDNGSPRSYGANGIDGLPAGISQWANNPSDGDGGNAAIHPMNDNIAFASEIGSGGLYGTVDAWTTETRLTLLPVFFPVPPIALDGTLTNPITLYIGDTNVYRVTWDGVNPVTRDVLGGAGNIVLTNGLPGARISAIAIAPGDRTRVYVGTSDSALWMSRNATSAPASVVWEQIDSGTSPTTRLPARPINCISVNPFNAGGMMVGFAGTGTNLLWGCADVTAGNANRIWFTLDSGPIAGVAVNSIARSPIDPNNIRYVATDFGVFRTPDAGTTWANITQANGLPNVMVTDLKSQNYGTDTYLFASTFGRGIWRLPIGPGNAQIAGFGITPNPDLPAFFATTLGLVTLSQPAGPGGVDIALSCDHPLVFTGGTRNMPQGQSSGTFNALSIFVSAPQTITYTAQVIASGETRNTFVNIVTAIPAAQPPLLPAPAFQSISRADDGSITLVWSGMSGSTYRVQYKSDLNSPTWNDLAPDIVADQDTVTFTDSPGAAPQRFYRVVLMH